MRVHGGAPVGLALLFAAGCGGSEPAARGTAVIPGVAYNDVPVPVAISGGPFRAAYTVDTGSGKTSIDRRAFSAFLVPLGATGPSVARIIIDDFVWRSSGELGGTLRPGVAPGAYDVELRDPRGNMAVIPGGFVSLGPDDDPPKLTFGMPAVDDVVAADTSIPVTLTADDGAGHLTSFHWTLFWRGMAYERFPCQLEPGASTSECPSTFDAPVPTGPSEEMRLVAEAEDSLGNRGTREIRISVAQRPRVDRFSPSAGPASGMTMLVIEGDNFIADATDIVVDGVPVGATVESATRISGLTPPHDPGKITVTVRTGSAAVRAGTFNYVGAPKIRVIEPGHGPVVGGTWLAIGGDEFSELTRIFFGRSAGGLSLLCQVLESPSRIVGLTPPGAMPGPITVYAEDPIAGSRSEGFTFVYDGPDGGSPGDGAAVPGPISCPDGGAP